MILWRIPRIRRHREEPLSIREDIDRLHQHSWNDPLLEEWFGSVVIPSDAGSPALHRSEIARHSFKRYSH